MADAHLKRSDVLIFDHQSRGYTQGKNREISQARQRAAVRITLVALVCIFGVMGSGTGMVYALVAKASFTTLAGTGALLVFSVALLAVNSAVTLRRRNAAVASLEEARDGYSEQLISEIPIEDIKRASRGETSATLRGILLTRVNAENVAEFNIEFICECFQEHPENEVLLNYLFEQRDDTLFADTGRARCLLVTPLITAENVAQVPFAFVEQCLIHSPRNQVLRDYVFAQPDVTIYGDLGRMIDSGSVESYPMNALKECLIAHPGNRAIMNKVFPNAHAQEDGYVIRLAKVLNNTNLPGYSLELLKRCWDLDQSKQTLCTYLMKHAGEDYKFTMLKRGYASEIVQQACKLHTLPRPEAIEFAKQHLEDPYYRHFVLQYGTHSEDQYRLKRSSEEADKPFIVEYLKTQLYPKFETMSLKALSETSPSFKLLLKFPDVFRDMAKGISKEWAYKIFSTMEEGVQTNLLHQLSTTELQKVRNDLAARQLRGAGHKGFLQTPAYAYLQKCDERKRMAVLDLLQGEKKLLKALNKAFPKKN